MLLNHLRRTPRHWDDALWPFCPDCGALLIPRRGPVVVWHWAHRSRFASGGSGGCGHEESRWHLCWKAVYLRWNGWEVEVPVTVRGVTYRADAARLSTRRVREFVHSLSDNYVAKHLALKRSGLGVLWIFDGDRFVAAGGLRASVGTGGETP